jgi:ABC-type antimicrobial peptide transport system permease subunit
MSGDTAAFLAGCAVTGVAALLLAKGDFASGQTGSLQPTQSVMPSSLATPAPTTTPSSDRLEDVQRGWQVQTKLEQQQDVARDLSDQLKSQQSLADDLKSQVVKQQSESEDLRSQLDKQQRNTEMLIAQMQEQQRVIDKVAAASQARPLDLSNRPSDNGNVQTIVLAIGAVILVVIVIGAIVLVGVVLLVAMSRRRQPRTVHVMQQPMPQSYAFPEQHLLAQRSNRVKPPKQIDVDYYTD